MYKWYAGCWKIIFYELQILLFWWKWKASVESMGFYFSMLFTSDCTVHRTWICWPEHGSLETEHGSCCSIWNETWISNSKKGWSVRRPFGWSGHRSMWKFTFESAHMLVWCLIPNFFHHDLSYTWGLNPDAGHCVLAWSMAYVTVCVLVLGYFLNILAQT